MMEQETTDSEKIKKMLQQDRDWMWDEGFYTVAKRMDRVLEHIKTLEKTNEID